MKTNIYRKSRAVAFLAVSGLIWCGAPSAFAQDETFLLDTENNKGQIVIFHGPDELHLDPETAVIAVDCFGDDEDLVVNGVTFIADKSDDNTVGEAENNGVKVTTTAANAIDAWSATTTFEGLDQDSADNLAIVMESIRWNGAPAPVSIEISGLTPGEPYEVQLLTNEGRGPVRYRVWDIVVEDTQVADNISSIGRLNEDEWDETNSAAYVGEFIAPGDGTFNIEMAQDLGGDPSGGVDNNPILNAIVVHRATPPVATVAGREELIDDGGADGWDLTVVLTTPIEEPAEPAGLTLGKVKSWSYIADDGRDGTLEEYVNTPLLVKQADGVFTVAGIGSPHTPEDIGEQLDIPFGLTKGSDTFVNGVGETFHIAVLQQRPDAANNDAGASIPFGAADGPGMFAMDTTPETAFEIDDEVTEGHASAEGGRNYSFNFLLNWQKNPDTDLDGLSDLFEDVNGLDKNDPADAALDKDGDGVSNLDEFKNKTDLGNKDTDGDGLEDGVETGTGTFVDATDSGTDPREDDTDGDGLTDGAEVATHKTDPTDEDTDDDSFSDGFENAFGSDPLVTASIPETPFGLITGGDPGEGLDLEGEFIYAVNASSSGEAGQAGDAFFTGIDESAGVTIDAVNDIPQWGGEMELGDSEADDVIELVLNGISWTGRPGGVIVTMENLEPGQEYKLQTLHAEKCCDRGWSFFIDDELVLADFNAGRLQLGDLDNPGGNAGTENGAYVAINFVAAGSTVVVELNGTDSPFPDGNAILNGFTLEKLGRSTPFQIMEVARGADGSVNLTWSSSPNQEYAVEYNETLTEPIWIELDDGVQSDGETTSFNDLDAERNGKPIGYYRVREN